MGYGAPVAAGQTVLQRFVLGTVGPGFIMTFGPFDYVADDIFPFWLLLDGLPAGQAVGFFVSGPNGGPDLIASFNISDSVTAIEGNLIGVAGIVGPDEMKAAFARNSDSATGVDGTTQAPGSPFTLQVQVTDQVTNFAIATLSKALGGQ